MNVVERECSASDRLDTRREAEATAWCGGAGPLTFSLPLITRRAPPELVSSITAPVHLRRGERAAWPRAAWPPSSANRIHPNTRPERAPPAEPSTTSRADEQSDGGRICLSV